MFLRANLHKNIFEMKQIINKKRSKKNEVNTTKKVYHIAHVLTLKEIEQNRSNAYQYIF